MSKTGTKHVQSASISSMIGKGNWIVQNGDSDVVQLNENQSRLMVPSSSKDRSLRVASQSCLMDYGSSKDRS